ncbi:Uncharacterised protein [Mycobacterium tuberculosis]|nr:Uncharacterised protein [Mycobacterium tuberculosis]
MRGSRYWRTTSLRGASNTNARTTAPSDIPAH